MPELGKLLLKPELPADLKVFYKPRGKFWHNTITLTFLSVLYCLPVSWYAQLYLSYPSYAAWRQVCLVPSAEPDEASASALYAGSAQLFLHLTVTGLIQGFLTGLQVDSVFEYKMQFESVQLLCAVSFWHSRSV